MCPPPPPNTLIKQCLSVLAARCLDAISYMVKKGHQLRAGAPSGGYV